MRVTLLTTRHLTVAVAAVVVASVGAAGTATTALSVPGRANTNPSISARGAFVVVTWAAATAAGVTDIYAAASRDGGRTFSSPARVNRVPGDARVSGEQPPRVELVPRGGTEPAVVVVWTARSPRGTRLVSARSEDGGKSFARPVPVPGSDASGNRGWESTAIDRDGHVIALWLDHRELAAAGGSSAPMRHDHDGQAHTGHGDADGVARAQRSKLYVARLDGGDGAQAIAGGVCYCCKTALAAGADGALYAAWRHVYPGNVRDIAFTLSRDGGRTFAPPVRVSDDQWVLDGCPENGPALAVDDRQTVHVVWPTLITGTVAGVEPTLALFYAATRDGQRFSARQQIHSEGVARHPQIAVGARGSLLVAWDEEVNTTRRVVIAAGSTTGKDAMRFTRLDVGDPQRTEYPAVTAVDDGFAAAWASGPPAQSVIRIGRLVAP